MPQGMLNPEFQHELAQLLNRHSIDNDCDTPDFMLAGMVTEFIETYRKTMQANINWHAPSPIGRTGAFTPPKASEIAGGPPVGPRLDGR